MEEQNSEDQEVVDKVEGVEALTPAQRIAAMRRAKKRAYKKVYRDKQKLKTQRKAEKQEAKEERGAEPADLHGKIFAVGHARIDKEVEIESLVAMPAPKEKEMMTIPAADFKAVMERLNRLENPGISSKPKRSKEHIGHMRMWGDSLVTRIGKAKDDYTLKLDDPRRMTLDVTLTAVGGEAKEEILPYLEFVTNADRVPIKFVRFDKGTRNAIDPKDGGGGWGNRAGIDKEGRLTDRLTGDEIAFEVTYTPVTAVVEITEGTFEGVQFTFVGDQCAAINA